MRPNVLVIKSDQHNARCLGINGHQDVRTPHLDALARNGVNFTRAFVQSPICSPSRMSYLSGQYPHNHGVFGLIEPRDRGPDLRMPSMFEVFRAAGYRTGIVGHIHVSAEWLSPHCDMYRDLYVPGDDYSAFLERRGLLHLRDDISYDDHQQTVDACPSRLDFEDSVEGYCLRSFVEFLQGQTADRPFLFQLDALHPHQNYIPVRDFWNLYGEEELHLPPSADEDLRAKPLHQRRQAAAERSNPALWHFGPKTYSEGRLRKLRGYYGCISQVDHLVGLVRRELGARGLLDNTIIVYCSDHGDFALEHGFLEKAPGISYDAILRVPLIWSWPAGSFTQGVNDELIESVDLFPTLCALADVPSPDTIDGVNISEMLFGRSAPVRDFVVAEFPLSRTIRTKSWKLCDRPRGVFGEASEGGELYNVEVDPWEVTNLYADPRWRGVRDDLQQTLRAWTLMTTRYDWIWPADGRGADRKVTTDALRQLVERNQLNYL